MTSASSGPRRGHERRPARSDYGVVDEIARRVHLSGGRVMAVRAADVTVAAILRYAI